MRYVLAGLAVFLMLAASIALVVRSFQTGDERVAAAPPAMEAPAAKPEPVPESPSAPAPVEVPVAAQPAVAPEAIPPVSVDPHGAPLAARAPTLVTPSAGAPLRLTAAQIDRVRYVLLSHSIMQAEASDLSLKVGASIPETVELTPLPIELADTIPAYARFSYAIVQNQIVIVTNAARRVELLIPAV